MHRKREWLSTSSTYSWDGDSDGCPVGGRVWPLKVGADESVGLAVGMEVGVSVGLTLGCSLGT